MRQIAREIIAIIKTSAIDEGLAWLLEFGLTTGETLRYARYASEVSYGGYTYSPWPFNGALRIGGKGQTIEISELAIDDAVQVLRPYLLQTNWFRGCTLTSTIICVTRPSSDYSTMTWTWDIKHAQVTDNAIVLRLGGPNIKAVRFPAEQYYAWQCEFAKGFKSDPRCGYSGAETTCNGLYSRCRELGNEARFAGFLGLDPGADVLVVPLSLRGLI